MRSRRCRSSPRRRSATSTPTPGPAAEPASGATPEEVAARMKIGGVELIDVREPGEYDERIQGDARSRPSIRTRRRRTSTSSSNAAPASARPWPPPRHKPGLSHTAHLAGGIQAWKGAGLPDTRQSNPIVIAGLDLAISCRREMRGPVRKCGHSSARPAHDGFNQQGSSTRVPWIWQIPGIARADDLHVLRDGLEIAHHAGLRHRRSSRSPIFCSRRGRELGDLRRGRVGGGAMRRSPAPWQCRSDPARRRATSAALRLVLIGRRRGRRDVGRGRNQLVEIRPPVRRSDRPWPAPGPAQAGPGPARRARSCHRRQRRHAQQHAASASHPPSHRRPFKISPALHCRTPRPAIGCALAAHPHQNRGGVVAALVARELQPIRVDVAARCGGSR